MTKIGHFASKIKMVKNMLKTILEPHKSCSVQKTAPINTYYSQNDNISKMTIRRDRNTVELHAPAH